jgi:tetratricopeptide (TPR) repeat protein
MQTENAPKPGGDNEKRGILRRNRPALLLWALFLASFLIVISLYAAFGETFIVKVYELQQLARAESRSISGAIIDYEDYLRVNPDSMRVRGLVVSALTEQRRYEEAMKHAEEALQRPGEGERGIAQLIAARAYLGAGRIDEAAEIVGDAMTRLPQSGEAHYEMAQVRLARGEFAEAEAEFAQVRDLGPRDSTREYAEAWSALTDKFESYPAGIEDPGDSPARLHDLGEELLRLGRLGEAVDLLEKAATGDTPPGNAVFWLGVRAEREGDLARAARLYRQAAQGADRHPHARYALERVQESRKEG